MKFSILVNLDFLLNKNCDFVEHKLTFLLNRDFRTLKFGGAFQISSDLDYPSELMLKYSNSHSEEIRGDPFLQISPFQNILKFHLSFLILKKVNLKKKINKEKKITGDLRDARPRGDQIG